MVFALIGVAAALGGIVQAVTGFGSGTVLMLILPHYFNMLVAPALSVAICLALNAAMLWRHRKGIEWKNVIIPGLCYIFGSLFAIRVAGTLNLRSISIAFGVFLLLLDVYFVFLAEKASLKNNLATGMFSCGISGLCAGFFGIVAPLMSLYFLQIAPKRETYFANMSVIFTVNTIISMWSRIAHGYYTADLIPETLFGMVFVLLGMKAGLKIADKLNAKTFKTVVYIFVGLSGLLILGEQLLK